MYKLYKLSVKVITITAITSHSSRTSTLNTTNNLGKIPNQEYIIGNKAFHYLNNYSYNLWTLLFLAME